MYWCIFYLASHLDTTLTTLEMHINRKVKNKCNYVKPCTISSKNISVY